MKSWKKRACSLLLGAMILSVMCVSAFAADSSSTTAIDTAGITSAFVSGFNSMVTNSINMVSAMVPIALTLAGVLFMVKKAMSWVKGMAK